MSALSLAKRNIDKKILFDVKDKISAHPCKAFDKIITSYKTLSQKVEKQAFQIIFVYVCAYVGLGIGFGCPCPPIRNNIATLHYLFFEIAVLTCICVLLSNR